MSPLLGGIEGGGTKFVCAVGSGPDDIRAQTSFPTTTPQETIGRAIEFFQEQHAIMPLDAIGIASFGPVDPEPRSPTYGYITTTPKAGWGHVDFRGPVAQALDVPVGFDTDVNSAALGEYRWGAGQGLDTLVYLTVGTGLGGGGVINGRLMHGLLHPEMGHMLLRHDWEADPFPGNCPFHGDCWEGMAAGPALEARWQVRAELLPPGHPCWPLEAHYLALGLVNIICLMSPQRIIMGGGVMKQTHLFPMLRTEVQAMLNGYVQMAEITERIEEYIVSPGLGDRAGVLGALALAEAALQAEVAK